MIRTASMMLCLFASTLAAQEKTPYEKFAVFIVGTEDAVPVVQSLTKLLNASKPFVVATRDASKASVLIKCVDKQKDQPFVCSYMTQYLGPTFSTLLGAGIGVGNTARVNVFETPRNIIY